MAVNILMLGIWIIVGFIDLIVKKQISKIDYGLVWFVLIIQIIENMINEH